MVQYGRNCTRVNLNGTGPGTRSCFELCKITEVDEAMVLFGEYDVYCKVIVDDFSKLSELILQNIRTLLVLLRPRH